MLKYKIQTGLRTTLLLDLNPINEFFAKLKGFKVKVSKFLEFSTQYFCDFLDWCINAVGVREKSAK